MSIMLLAYVFQRKLIYMPFGGSPRLPNNIGAQEMAVVASDGTMTEGWHLKSEGSSVTLLMFHGNAGHRGHRLGWAMAVRRALGVGVILTDPRGYGGNRGSPTEKGLYMDGEACLQWAREVVGGKIVLYGESIGGGVAVELAKREAERGRPVDGLILQAAFASLVEVASGAYPFLFPDKLLHDRYTNIQKIHKINCPLLIIHGTRDNIVPFDHGRRMYQRAKQPKAMLTVPGGDHNAVVYKAGMEYYAQMESFLRTHVDRDTSLRVDPTKKYPVPKKASAANIAAQIPETLPEMSTEYLAAAQPVKPEKELNTAELKASVNCDESSSGGEETCRWM